MALAVGNEKSERKDFALIRMISKDKAMTSPLAVICYEKLLPGSQMVNRLQDLGYRVVSVNDAGELASVVREQKPMVVVADLESKGSNVSATISSLRKDPETTHIPILAFARSDDEDLQMSARAAGARLVAVEEAILDQLPMLLDRVLEVS